MTDKTETAAPATLTAPEAAKKIGTDGKSFRRFLRSDASPISAVGQGARYAIDPKDLPALKKGFAKFQAEQEAKRAARAEAKAKSEPETDEDSENEVDEEPKPERTEDMVDKVQAAGGLPKAEQVKANARKTRKAASEAARKPETATA